MITQKQLKEWIEYNPKTGDFKAIKNSRNNTRRAGDLCGSCNPRGYLEITVLSRGYFAHRLAFLYMTGSLPNGDVDHINHIKNDNRWANLRDVRHSSNQKNKPKHSNNKSGFTGVSWCKRSSKWYSSISVNSKSINLGLHEDLNDAVLARKQAEIKYGFHINHGK